jgi:hypothetical protein
VRSVPIPTINEDELLIKGAYLCNSLMVLLTTASILFQSHVAVSTFVLIDVRSTDRILHRYMRD